MSDKKHSIRVEEQRIISNFAEFLEYLLGREDNPARKHLTRHDGYTYPTMVDGGKKLTIRFEVELESSE